MDTISPSPFLALPSEVRLTIYRFLIRDGAITIWARHKHPARVSKPLAIRSPLRLHWNLSATSQLRLVCKTFNFEIGPLLAPATQVLRIKPRGRCHAALQLVPQLILNHIRQLKISKVPWFEKWQLPRLEAIQISNPSTKHVFVHGPLSVQLQDWHWNMDRTLDSLRHVWRVNVNDPTLKVFGRRLHLVFDPPRSPDFDCNLRVINVSPVGKSFLHYRRHLTNAA
jgi:hypothetical protein